MSRKVAIKEWRSWKQIATKYLLQVMPLSLAGYVHPHLSFCYVISFPLFSVQHLVSLMDDEQTGAGYVLRGLS